MSTMSVTRLPLFLQNSLSEGLLTAHAVQYYVPIRSVVSEESEEDKGTKQPGSTLAENCAAPVLNIFFTFLLELKPGSPEDSASPTAS